jgi:hypothetical protein
VGAPAAYNCTVGKFCFIFQHDVNGTFMWKNSSEIHEYRISTWKLFLIRNSLLNSTKQDSWLPSFCLWNLVRFV